MSGALDTVLAGTRVVIKTTLGEYAVELDDNSPPGPLTRLLKPQVSVERGSLLLYRAAPYGEPVRPVWLIPALLVLVAVVIAFVAG